MTDTPSDVADTIEVDEEKPTRKRKSTRFEETNGKSNGQANGHANGHANSSAKEKKVVDGWIEGQDPKIDYSGHFEFGGSFGVLAIMIGFPLLMYYMWIGATYFDGKAPTPDSGESYIDFFKRLAGLAYEGAFPTAKAWAMYWIFFITELAFYYYLPGVYKKGKPLPHEGGKKLDYYCSGVWSFYTTIAILTVLHVTGLFPLRTIMDEFGPLMSVSILSGFLMSVYFYFSAILLGKQHRMTGYPIYDFFMGAELNPRWFYWIDFKMFFEVRIPWYILYFVTLSGAVRQYEQYGYVSAEMGLLIFAHWLYANACSKGEECIVPSWDMYYEKLGFMLTFWNMSGVPLSYCHAAVYLANHDPATYRWNRGIMAIWFVAYAFVYWVWDTTNSQKNRFRAQETGDDIPRTTFPQLPWQTVENPRVIKSPAGTILADGWCKSSPAYPLTPSPPHAKTYSSTDGKARKIHYTCDLFFALSWALVTGFKSPFPWFYPVFFATMIIHRAIRDIQRCRQKYGDAWAEYERTVPYLWIPVSFSPLS